MSTRDIPSPLFHYTCADHGSAGINASGGEIRPGRDGVVWLTDLRIPNRDALGLTSNFIHCDRTAYRFDVADTTGVLWWPEWRRGASAEWQEWARYLESAPDVRPVHWYLSESSVRGRPS